MIPEEIEEKLHYIELFTRKKIRNPLVGNHVSMLRGHGYDFWDHKRYQIGDDTRRIDWNATARMGYTLIRNTHEEKDLDIWIVADMSNSMDLVTGDGSKKELLLYVTAAVAYSALSDHMRIGFVGFSEDVEIEIDAKKGRAHLWTILNQIWDYSPQTHHATRILPTLETLSRKLRKMSIVFLVSDFLFEENMFEDLAFKQLSTRHDLIPLILSDPLESNLPEGRGFVRLRDLETGKDLCIRLSAKNRLYYAEQIRQRERYLIQQCYRFGLDFQKIRTGESFYELVLGLFLLRRRS